LGDERGWKKVYKNYCLKKAELRHLDPSAEEYNLLHLSVRQDFIIDLLSWDVEAADGIVCLEIEYCKILIEHPDGISTDERIWDMCNGKSVPPTGGIPEPRGTSPRMSRIPTLALRPRS
jgi:hypothetical protein